MKAPHRRWVYSAAATTGVCVCAVGLAACAPSEAERGRRLFGGELPLDARIAGHDADLPSHASRCSNCHARAETSAASAPAFAVLSSQRLLEPLPRRGGPPSRFDEASLCRLLRTGIDPAHVVVAGAMPRYRIDDADCRALWAHLSRAAS